MGQLAQIKGQVVGAYGEKAVEAELLRHGWITANINTSIKNAADFDIFAHKGDRSVNIRVKTSGPGTNAFQFGFRPTQDIIPKNIGASDFTVLVSMGDTRDADCFYVIPTGTLRKQIQEHANSYMSQTRKDGGPRKDMGMWTLHLAELRSGEDRPSHGYARKWSAYKDNWSSLE